MGRLQHRSNDNHGHTSCSWSGEIYCNRRSTSTKIAGLGAVFNAKEGASVMRRTACALLIAHIAAAVALVVAAASPALALTSPITKGSVTIRLSTFATI